MAMDLKSILETMKKTYSFRVKIAADITDENLKNVDTILNVKGMTKRTKPEALPLASTPYDFPRLQGFFGTIYKFEMDFEYPITPSQIVNELSTQLGLDRAYIVVRNIDAPVEQYESTYLEYKDVDYISQLVQDEIDNKINPNDYYGDEYNKDLVKALQSKEAKKHQQGFTELDKKKYKGAE